MVSKTITIGSFKKSVNSLGESSIEEWSPRCINEHSTPIIGLPAIAVKAIYGDDFITQLLFTGYGAHIGSLYVGCILYADDIV